MSGAAASAGASKFQAFMNHPAGPKTVFFWAPLMKWCLVAAGVKDLSRPAEKLSVSQNLALTATGFIWVRYSMVITPVNYSLAAVNMFVGATGLGQLARIWHYQRTHEDPVVAIFGSPSEAGPTTQKAGSTTSSA
ncbi:Mitochondrial pyruvate carrier 2 [Taiwanofungus camphoratus]|nr:Mitochondrial pyruvate carrier 2 [Antrodia cinnamomea]KAI0958529.1 Mitochondrial pyruvate carrier 2 [Antrodia cinnamomea]